MCLLVVIFICTFPVRTAPAPSLSSNEIKMLSKGDIVLWGHHLGPYIIVLSGINL
jgi:hypothetical protein